MDKNTIANQFFLEIFKANKQFVLEAWRDWQDFTEQARKADVKKSYPDGFKDLLVERLEKEIVDNSPKE